LDKNIKVKNGGNMALIYVTGGAKSGKSSFAEDLLLGMNNGNQKNIYLATSIVFDEEIKAKVALHKERRHDKWITAESYKNFSETLKDVLSDERKNNMLVDCLTNMISNIIFEEQDINWDKPSEKDFEKCNILVEKQVNELINVINRFENAVIVSNELGMGIVPSYPLGRYFREIAGKMNQKIAEIADEAYFVVSGIPMKIK
jgi:bifunctional adenosylcobalamin biosynthesis protein CobU